MKKSLFFLSLLAVSVHAAEPLEPSAANVVKSYMTMTGAPALSVAIVKADGTTSSGAYGTSTIPNGTTVNAQTLFAAGPISQSFAVAAILKLAEAKKLSLDSTVNLYLQNLPAEWPAISLRNLIQHTSGLADYRDNPNYDPMALSTYDSLLALATSQPLKFQPGYGVKYSATDGLLLAKIVEVVSHQPYREYVKNEIFKPLKMTQSRFAADLAMETNIATGYSFTNPGMIALPAVQPEALTGFADVWTTAEELGKIPMLWTGGAVLTDASSYSYFTQPTNAGNGITYPATAGWELLFASTTEECSGSTSGCSARLTVFNTPDKVAAIAIMTNLGDQNLSGLRINLQNAMGIKVGDQVDNPNFFVAQSVYSVSETYTNLEGLMLSDELPIDAEINNNAQTSTITVPMSLNNIMFFGTPNLVQPAVEGAEYSDIVVPIRFGCWEGNDKTTFVVFPLIARLAEQYQVNGKPGILAAQNFFEKIVQNATTVYQR